MFQVQSISIERSLTLCQSSQFTTLVFAVSEVGQLAVIIVRIFRMGLKVLKGQKPGLRNVLAAKLMVKGS
jgi:hypothetical protein